jgi:hypothetical protein
MWLMIESPAKAFRKIILSEQKNYVLVIGLFLGIAASFLLMYVNTSGNSFDNLFLALLFGSVVGGMISAPLILALTVGIHGISRLIGGKGTIRESFGVVGWSFMPMVFIVVCILPLQLATLGLFAFSSNPTAYQVKPVVTVVLYGLEGLFILWSVLLLAVGISMAHRFVFIKGLIIGLLVTCMIGYGSFLIYSSFNI